MVNYTRNKNKGDYCMFNAYKNFWKGYAKLLLVVQLVQILVDYFKLINLYSSIRNIML